MRDVTKQHHTSPPLMSRAANIGSRRTGFISGAMRFIASALVSASLMSCADGPQHISFNVGDAGYRIPTGHVSSLTQEPHQFVSIKPPDHGYELVYDSRVVGRLDRFGWPSIPSVNVGAAPNIERYARDDLKIVCRRAGSPWGGCGFRVVHGGVEWAVRFPEGQRTDPRTIREKAIAVLDDYRG